MDELDHESSQSQQQSPVLYKNRPEWNDVKPIYNSDEANCIVRIASSEEFDDAFAYLSACMNAKELSGRALELTQTCINLNAANYTVWQYRREILRALGSDIGQELRYCEEIINDNPKNYQVWHHRKSLVEESGHYSGELEFTVAQLEEEPKNYHAWQYRQWLVEHFGLFSMDEINFSAQCLFEDIRNNSAWNYRFFIGATLSDGFQQNDFMNSEISFTLGCIKKAPSNESAWSYLSGILINDKEGADRPEIVSCIGELQARDPPTASPHLYLFLVDSLAEKMRQCSADEEQRAKYLRDAIKHLDYLEKIDPMRHNYWQYKKHSLLNLTS